MPVHIDRIDSTVDVEPGARQQGGGEQTPMWERLERARRIRERDDRDRARTSAWDDDD